MKRFWLIISWVWTMRRCMKPALKKTISVKATWREVTAYIDDPEHQRP